MSRRVIVGSLVVVAVALILWLKPRTPTNGTPEVPDPALAPAVTQVLLFADPREVESSCGCGQIIRMVRAADVPGSWRFRSSTRSVSPRRSVSTPCEWLQPSSSLEATALNRHGSRASLRTSSPAYAWRSPR